MCQTILIIEDNRRIANWVKVYFERAGFCAEIAYDGEEGLASARSLAPDLIVLDLMLPSLDGITVCNTLRRESDVPIIILTAKDTQAERIKGLETGADDYIGKPFDPEEVVARARAVLRRAQGQVQQVLTCNNIILNIAARKVIIDERPIALSHTQFSILTAFMRHPNQVLSRDQIISLVFPDDFDGYDRAIDNHILRLRKQLAKSGRQPIQTVYGAGYRFAVEDA